MFHSKRGSVILEELVIPLLQLVIIVVVNMVDVVVVVIVVIVVVVVLVVLVVVEVVVVVLVVVEVVEVMVVVGVVVGVVVIAVVVVFVVVIVVLQFVVVGCGGGLLEKYETEAKSNKKLCNLSLSNVIFLKYFGAQFCSEVAQCTTFSVCNKRYLCVKPWARWCDGAKIRPAAHLCFLFFLLQTALPEVPSGPKSSRP